MKYSIFGVLIGFICLSLNGQMVVDNGNFFSVSEEKKLIEKCHDIKERTTSQILIYSTDDLNGKSPKDYGEEIWMKYPAGIKGINNGVLILFSKNDRKLQILLGYGLEWILTDDDTQKIVDQIIPYFKDSRYYEGIIEGLILIDKEVSLFDWSVYSMDIDKVSSDDTGNIIKMKFSKNALKQKYKYGMDYDPQFSDDLTIKLMGEIQSFNLYYSKYMNDLVSKITAYEKMTIYARLIDWDSKKFVLMGIE